MRFNKDIWGIQIIFLHHLDDHAQRHVLFYCRFMDDWLLLTNTKRQLRVGVRLMNTVLGQLKLLKAPDKTFIGRIKRGFDFLGYRLGESASKGVGLARQTWLNHRDRLLRLYEQGASLGALRKYVRRWLIYSRLPCLSP